MPAIDMSRGLLVWLDLKGLTGPIIIAATRPLNAFCNRSTSSFESRLLIKVCIAQAPVLEVEMRNINGPISLRICTRCVVLHFGIRLNATCNQREIYQSGSDL